MAKSVEFEVLLKNGQLKEAAQESKKAIEDVGSAVSGSSSAMSEEFTELKAQLDLQKEIIRTLREEIGKLEAALKNVSPGNEWSNVTAEIGSLNQELTREEQGITELGSKLEETEQKHVSLRAQIKATKEEMAAMALAGKDNTAEYEALKQRLGELTDIYGDISAQGKELANDERNLQGIISGLTGLSGAFSAATGAVALFGGENENLQKIMLKVQSLMAITVGLQQVEQALNKDSAFRLVTINGLKEWWAKVVKDATAAEANETATLAANATAMTANATATAAAGTAATGTAGAFKILGAAIKSVPVIGWILAAVAGLGSLIGLIVKERKAEKENNAVLKERRDIIKEVNEVRRSAVESVAEEESKLRTQIKLLKQSKEGTESYNRSVRAVAQSLGVNEEWLKRNKNKVDELADAWVNVKRSEAMSEAYAKQYAEERINGEKKLLAFRQAASTNNMEGNKQDLIQAGFSEQQAQVIADNVHRKFGKNPAKRRDGIEWLYDYERKLIEDNQKALDTITGQQEAAINSQIAVWKQYDELTKGNGKNTDGGKGISGAETSDPEVKGWQAELAKLTDARNKALDEMKSLIGKTIHYDFGDVTYDADSIKEDLEKIERDFQNAVYELAKDYGMEFKVPVEVNVDNSSYQALLDQYADYERKKSNIQKEYSEQRSKANGDAALIAKIDDAEKKALAKLSYEALKSSSAFDELYNGAERLGVSMKKLLKDRVEKLVNYINQHKGDLSFKASNEDASAFGIDAETLNNILQSDDALDKLVSDLDKIEQSDAIGGLIKAVKKLKEAKDNAQLGDIFSEENVAKAADVLMDAIGNVQGALTAALSSVSEILHSIAESTGSDRIAKTASYLDDFINNINAAAQGVSAYGGWWGAIIGGGLDIIDKIIEYSSGVKKWNMAIEKLELRMHKLSAALSELDASMENGQTAEQISIRYELLAENAALAYRKMMDVFHKTGGDQDSQEYVDALHDYMEAISELKSVYEDYFEYLSGENVTSVFDNLSDMIWAAFQSGEDAIDDFEEYFNEMLVNMIKKKVLWEAIGDRVEQYVSDVAYHVQQGNLTGDDAENYINWLRGVGEEIVQDGATAIEALKPIFDGLMQSVYGADSLSGSIQGITAEQASMLAGQMNAMRTAQAAQTELLTSQLEALNDIEHNTRYVRDIYNFLRQNNVGANSNLNRAYGQN